MNMMNMNAINENIERMEQDNIMFDMNYPGHTRLLDTYACTCPHERRC